MLVGVTGISLGILGSDATSRLSYRSTDIYSHSSESFQAIRQIETPQHRLWRGPPNISVIVRPSDAIERTRSVLEGLPQVVKVEEHTFYSNDGNTGYIVGWVRHGSREPERAAQVADEISRPGVVVGGSALAQYQFGQEVARDLRRAELIAFPLLILVGLWVFRSFVSALLPVAVGAVVVLSALGVMRAMTELLPISVFSMNIAVALALGLSVDYSLLLLSRFREEIHVRASSREAAWVAVATAGRTVFFSSAVIFASFASLMVFPIPVVRSIAFGGMLVAPLAGLAALLMLPALFSLLGGRVNALALRGRRSEAVPSKAFNWGWRGVARLVTGHPRVVASGAVLLLVSLALPALAMRFTGFDATSLPPSSSVRVFYERARSQFDNPIEGEIGILIRANQERTERIIPRLVDMSDHNGLATPFPAAFEVARHRWLLDLNPAPPVLSQKTKQFVERLRDMNAPILVTGETAAYLDTQSALKRGLPYALTMLAAVSFFILWMATGSVVLPIKALVMNLLVLGAVLGLLVVIFQRGNFQQVLGYESRDALVLTLPIVIAAGAFGVLTDYGLFLLMRIKETKDNGLGNKEAVAVGLEKAAGVITGAAVLFCAGVGAFASSDIVLLKEAAIGIAAAVALDAFVVRPFLMPSLMVLLGRWNWWPQQAR